ncbi:MAG: ABC transporter permease [Chloroflexi bacterium]|nr:ABC transporter permease [Chloroflexota bacterium]
MFRYLLRRLVIAVVLIFGAATLVFVLLHAVPGDPVRIFLGDFATEAQIQAVRTKMGLDRTIPEQYFGWLLGVAHGDLGTSLTQNTPVFGLLLDRLSRTLELTLVSILLALLVGIPLGIGAALHRGRLPDVVLTLGALGSLSVPVYVSGTVLVLIFAVGLHWLPASGYVAFEQNPLRHMSLLVAPCVTLASHLAASLARMTRSSVLEVIGQDYIRTARSKGLAEAAVLVRHVLRNSLVPITTTVGVQAGNLLGGAVIVETIFAWPGISSLMFRGIETHDYPVVQGCVLLISALFILFTLVMDLVNAVTDPRLARGAPA